VYVASKLMLNIYRLKGLCHQFRIASQ
jgi:hypothetical protein